VKVRSGGQSRIAEIADGLALHDVRAFDDAASETRHVIVCGYVAVGVLDFHPPPVAAIPAGLDDDAVARGENRRADRRRPVDASVHARIMQDRMIAHAERRRHFPLRDRFAHQEFAHRPAVLVVKIDHVVVGRLESVVLERLVADGHRRAQKLGPRIDVVRVGIKRLDRIARRSRALEIHVICENSR